MSALQLLALRIAVGVHVPTLAEIRELQAAGYRGWTRGKERRVLPADKQPTSDGWICVDVSTFGTETWAVERVCTTLGQTYDCRDAAIDAAWRDAIRLGSERPVQMLAVLARPPGGYAVRLVAGTTTGPTLLESWAAISPRASR